jgi:flagellar hook-associated protein 2
VTLTTSPDASGLSDKVQAMVDAANSVLSSIATDTAYNTQTNTASVLTGDFTATQLINNILSSVSNALGNGASASSVGLSVTKDGQLSFDASAFKAAFAADPVAVQNAFGPSGTYAPPSGSTLSGGITLQRSTDSTQAGTYDVVITQAATKASATINTTGLAASDTITLGSGGNTSTYTVTAGDTVQSVINQLNAMSAANNLGVNATLDPDGSTIDLTAAGYGSGYTFTASSTGIATSAVTPGLDVAGTINGQAAMGNGQLLYTMPGTPSLDAFTLQVTLTTADVASLAGGNVGTFTYAQGASQKLANVAYAAVATTTGSLTSQISSESTIISGLNTQIANWQVILDTKQVALERQWANLESQLSGLQAQGSQLSAAILAMNGVGSSSSSKS